MEAVVVCHGGHLGRLGPNLPQQPSYNDQSSLPQGPKDVLDLISKVDIWMESPIPGTYPAWGLDDATVMMANPELVITHVPGHGQDAHPDYLGRASYDFIGQGFGGLMKPHGVPKPRASD